MNTSEIHKNLHKALLSISNQYNEAKSIMTVEHERAKGLFEDSMSDLFLIRKMKNQYSLKKAEERQLASQIDRIVRLIQDHLKHLNDEENNREFQEKKLYEKFNMSRYLKEQQLSMYNTSKHNEDLKYYRNFSNKTLCEPWHLKTLSLLLKPVIFHMNVAKNNIITLIAPKSCGKTFFMHAIERYTKTLQELKSKVDWIIINLFQFEAFVKNQITSKYLHQLKKYTYFVLEAITIDEFFKYIITDYFQTFLRMIQSHSKCFFIIMLHSTTCTETTQEIQETQKTQKTQKTQEVLTDITNYLPHQGIIYFNHISAFTIYHFFKNMLVSHFVQLLEMRKDKNSHIEPFHDLEQHFKQIPTIDIIERTNTNMKTMTTPEFQRYQKFLSDFDIMNNYSELLYVAQQITVQLPSCNFDQLQQIFFNTILQSNEKVVKTKQFILCSFSDQMIAHYLPVGSFQKIIQEKVHSPEIFLLFNDNHLDLIHEIQILKHKTIKTDHKNHTIANKTIISNDSVPVISFHHTMFFNDLYPETDSRYDLYISPDKNHVLMKFSQSLVFENDFYVTFHEASLIYTFLDLFLNLQSVYELSKESDIKQTSVLLSQINDQRYFTTPLCSLNSLNTHLFPTYHVQTKFFEITKQIFQEKSGNVSNSFHFVVNANFHNNMNSTKKSFRFQLSINEQHTKDLISSGLHEGLSIETFQQVFTKLFHQTELTNCLIKKLSFASGFRLYITFINFQNRKNIDFSNIEVYKNQQDTTLICLPLIPYELHFETITSTGKSSFIKSNPLILRSDYCITNAMDYYLIFNKTPNENQLRKYILKELSTKQIQILNDIYNNEQIFHLNILCCIMKQFKVSNSLDCTILKSLYQELYGYCCELLHIPLLANTDHFEVNDKNIDSEENDKLFYHQLDSHFLRRKTLDSFYVNPLIILHLFQHFRNAELFQSVYEGYELFVNYVKTNVKNINNNNMNNVKFIHNTVKMINIKTNNTNKTNKFNKTNKTNKTNKIHDTNDTNDTNNNNNNNNNNIIVSDQRDSLRIQWFVYNKYNEETDVIIKSNHDVSHLMKHAIHLFPCNKDFIEHLHQRCMTSAFFHSFTEVAINESPFEILFQIYDDLHDSLRSSSYFRVHNFQITNNIEIFLQLLHNEQICSIRIPLLSHDKHKRIILSLLLADKHYSTNETNVAVMFLAYYLYFDQISLSLTFKHHNIVSQDILLSLLCQDLQNSLNYLYHFLDEKKHKEVQIIFRCNLPNEAIKMIDLKQIHKTLHREIQNGMQQIKNTYVTSNMILDEFYLFSHQK